jgi:general secretion pathway protein D
MSPTANKVALCAIGTLVAGALLAACSAPEDRGIEARRDRAARELLAAEAERDAGKSGAARTRDGGTLAFGNGAGAEAGMLQDLQELEALEGLESEEDFAPPPPRRASRPAARPAERAPRAAARGAPPAPAPGDPAERVFEEIRQERSARRMEARFHAQKGDEAFEQNRHREARDLYRRALDLDPTLEETRRRMNQAMAFLGERPGEEKSVAEDFFSREQVARQQTLRTIERNLGLARKSFERGDVDEAERLASVAADMIRQSPELVVEERRREAEQLLELIRRSKSARAEERRLELMRETARVAEDEEARLDAIKQRQVQDLLRRALQFLRRKEYSQAVETCESVLKLDPDNAVASFWMRSAKDQLIKQRGLKVILDRMQNQSKLEENFLVAATPTELNFEFPDDDYWYEVRKRQAGLLQSEFQDPEPIRRIKAALESARVDYSFDGTPLSDVIATFRQITAVNILIDPQVDGESEELKVTQPINGLTAMSALRLILESKDLAYTFLENTLVITNKGEAREPTTLEVYNVTDLLQKVRNFAAPEIRLRGANDQQGDSPISFTESLEEDDEPLDPDALIQLIRDSTGGEAEWPEGTTIEYNQGNLFVDAPHALHAKINNVLENLRQDSDLFVVIEARFIDITDDFLEDIGIDARSLGVVNNLGTRFGNIINDSSTGGNDLGIVQQGDPSNINLVMGTDRWAGRVQHIIDGFGGSIRGERLTAGRVGGGTFQATWLEPFQVNTILRVVQEKSDVRQLTAPIVTAHNNERVYVSVITQRAYIADYELVSGGTGFQIVEVADPVVQTFQEGVILDVNPTISHDKKYITLDVRPTLATLIGGVISTLRISLGSFTNVAFQVPIGIPQISLQQSFTSVTVPNGGTVLLGGFKSLNEGKFTSYLPILGHIPIIKNLARRKATISEKRSLVILLSARIVDLRQEEARRFNRD